MNSEGNIILQTPQNAIFFKTCQQGNAKENMPEQCLIRSPNFLMFLSGKGLEKMEIKWSQNM